MKRGHLLGIVGVVAFLGMLAAHHTPGTQHTDTTYLQLRHVQSIEDTKTPLSYEQHTLYERPFLGLPLYPYLLKASSILNPVLGPYVLNALLFAISIVIVTMICLAFTKSISATLLAAVALGISSAFTTFFLHVHNPFAFALPWLLYLLYTFSHVRKNKKYIPRFIMSVIVLSFIHPIILVVLMCLIIYWLLSLIMHHTIHPHETESLIFTVCFVLWSQFIIYKKAILFHGVSVIWQNIPPSLLADVYTQVTIPAVILALGPVVVLGALLSIIATQWERRQDTLKLFASLLLTCVVLAAFRFLSWDLIMTLIALATVVLFSKSVVLTMHYVERTKASRAAYAVPFVILALIFSSVASYAIHPVHTPHIEEDAIVYLRQVDPTSVLWTDPRTGHEIIYKTGKTVVQNTYFLLESDASARFDAYQKLLNTKSVIQALTHAHEQSATHIIVSNGEDLPHFTTDTTCFPVVYNGATTIIAVRCQVDEPV